MSESIKKVVKFGGSSLASAEQFRKSAAIVLAEESRRYVVPSAPGKRFPEDEKVTDMLLDCHRLASEGQDFSARLAAVRERYEQIRGGLGLAVSLDEAFAAIEENLRRGCSRDYAASRGEYLNGILLAFYLGYAFIDAAEVVFFDANGVFDGDRTNRVMGERLAQARNAVIPGFYGVTPDRKIRTFSRGGSDITGALAAAALNADVYENWTDVSGILMADPRIVPDPLPIERITYNELRELSFVGAQVLHEGTVFPVREKNIPLNIRNTNDPDHPGTLIMESFDDVDDGRLITGIAGKKNYSIITIAKSGMSSSVGTFRQVFEVFERHGVSIEYAPSGIDCLSLVVSSEKVAPCLYSILGELEKQLHPDNLHVTENISIVAAVGRKMVFRPGTSGRIFAALGEHGINIRMISQGPDELNIIVGVDTKDFAPAIQVLYNSFVK